MKKILSLAFICLLALTAQAQAPDNFDPLRDRQMYFDILNICGILAAMFIIASFIQQIIRQYYAYRIRNRMLDKGTEESIVREMLKPEKKDSRQVMLQWFCILASIGAGLLLVTLIRPFGLHSLAILAISIAAGFGANYYFTRQAAR